MGSPHARAESVWYRVAGLAAKNDKAMALEIIESEIRSAQREVLLEAAKLIVSSDRLRARELREWAAKLIRPNGGT